MIASQIAARFIRDEPREGVQGVTLSEVQQIIERHHRPVADEWPVSESLALRFIRSMEEKWTQP